MTEPKPAQVEQLERRDEVQRELQRTGATAEPKVVVETKHKVWFGTYLLTLFGLAGFYYLLRLRIFDFAAPYVPVLQRLTVGAMAIGLVFAITQVASTYLIGRLGDPVSQYNLRRILRLVAALVIVVIVVSVLLATW